MRRSHGGASFLAALLVFCLFAFSAFADLTFPTLTGRVVDAAHVLSPAARATLEQKLAAQEAKTSDQFVVATVPSLQGTSIEDYANRLFRFWKLGQAKQNNGVLLLVAPGERKVRIEVGYGLEGIITDAVASTIIHTAIIPAFRAGDMAGGIERGADAVLEILNLDPEEARQRAKALAEREAGDGWIPIVIFIVMVLIFILIVYNGGGGGRNMRRRGGVVYFPTGGGGWSSGSGGGGFSGGGGSSGGGGASGGW